MPKVQFNWDSSLTSPPALGEGEASFSVRFYLPGEQDVAEVPWDGTHYAITLEAQNPAVRGIGIALLAKRMYTSRVNEPAHARWRVRAQGVAKTNEVELRDPSDDYAVIATIILDGRLPPLKSIVPQWDALNEFASREMFSKQAARLPQPLVPATKNMRLRRYTTVLGNLPAAAFALEGCRSVLQDMSLLDYLLEAGSFMAGWTHSALIDELKSIMRDQPRHLSPTQKRAISIAFTGLCLVGTSNDYVNDVKQGGKADAERFQIPLSQGLGEGDCEDVAKEIQLLCLGIQNLPKGAHVMGDLMKQYAIVMLTAVATSPSLQRFGAMDKGEDPSQYICHVFAAALPNDALATMLGKTDRYNLTNSPLQQALCEMGAVILEGTNFSAVLLRELPAYVHEEGEVKDIAELKWKELALRTEKLPPALQVLGYELPAVPTLKRPQTLAEFSAFYRFVTGMWVVDNPVGEGIDFAIMQDGKYGTTMQNFVELSPSVTARAIYKISPQMLDGINEALRFQIPIVPYSTDAIELKGTMGEFGAITSPSALERPFRPPFIDLRFQHANEMTRERCMALKEMQRKGWQVEARVFGFRPTMGVYCIRLWAPDSVMPSSKAMGQSKMNMP